MGWMRKLLGRRQAEPEAPVTPGDWIERDLWLLWEDAPRNYIAGESSYTGALSRLCGPICKDGYCLPVVVKLVREPRNPYDGNAFRAEVSGEHVGYLRRHLAAQLAGPADRAGLREVAVCGVIRGGATDAPNFGVHVWLNRTLTPGVALELPDADEEWAVPWPPLERASRGAAQR
jgi:hypothetical protein